MSPMVRGPTPINILLVEDDPSDVELTRRALQSAKLQNRVWIVGDGVEALAFLRREGPHRGVPRPDVVLTASDAEHEQLAALAADGFLTKPVDFARLETVIRRIAGLGWAIVRTAP